MILDELIAEQKEKYKELLCDRCGELMTTEKNAFLFLRGRKEDDRCWDNDGCVVKRKRIGDGFYRRKRCYSCFEKMYNRKPKPMNIVNEDMVFLFNITEDMVKDGIRERAVTKENMVKKYGKVGGIERWERYCKKQSVKNTFEFKHKKYGWTREQFDLFNKKRAITEENLIKKHGKDKGREKYKKYCARQAYAGCKEEYFIEKYGRTDGKRKYKELNKQKSLTLGNFVRKYGESLGLENFTKYVNMQRKNYSDVANELFDRVAERYLDKENIHYNKVNGEYVFFVGEKDKSYISVDFYDSKTNKVIEFYGTYWHCDERIYGGDFYNTSVKKTAEQIWNDDAIRESVVKSRYGADLLVIHQKDYVEDKGGTVKRCLEFLGLTKESGVV